MAWDLGSNLDQEAERALVTAAFGAGRAANLFPDYPLDDFDPIVGRGTVVDKEFDPTARRSSARPLPDLETLTQPAGAGRALAEVSRMNAALAPLLSPRRGGGRDRLELLGGLGCPHGERPAAAVQRPPPGRLDPVGLRPGRTALPHGHRRLPLRRGRVQPGLGARGGDRPQHLRRLGTDHQLSRRAGPLSRGGRRQPGPGGGRARPAEDGDRADPGGGGGAAADDHHPVLPARSLVVRREPAAAAGRRHPGPARRTGATRWP